MISDQIKKDPDSAVKPLGPAGRIARAFIGSKLTPMVVLTAILLGAFAIVMLPREEEPQIKVPMIDVMVAMPGTTAGIGGTRHPANGETSVGDSRG